MRYIKSKSRIILITLTLTLAGIAVFGAVNTYAQDREGPYQSIIQKLVQRFGLKESDVRAVFDESRNERLSQMQVRFEERLNQDVKDGKLTEAQKQAIIVKHRELQEKRQTNWESYKNMTSEEKRTAMQTEKQELDSWVKQNGIDLSYFFGGHKGGHMIEMKGWWGNK